jgi:peroxiredoxin
LELVVAQSATLLIKKRGRIFKAGLSRTFESEGQADKAINQLLAFG